MSVDIDTAQRIAERVWVEPETECHIWQGTRSQDGYARLSVLGIQLDLHRFVFEAVHGTLAAGLVVDHICRNRSCVNPAHLEGVTQRENILRGVSLVAENAKKTHCKRGHRFSASNTYSYRGQRACRQCNALRAAESKMRRATGALNNGR